MDSADYRALGEQCLAASATKVTCWAATEFANVNKCLAAASPTIRHQLADLWTVSDVTGVEQPLLFKHPGINDYYF